MNYWLIKQEPEDYSWSTFAKEGITAWTGVRNFQARNNLRSMKAGDIVLFYHSGAERSVVGLARVARQAYPDPTADEGDWSAVDLMPFKSLVKPVMLSQIKTDKILNAMKLVKQSRLSVMPVAAVEFNRLLVLADTKV